MRRAEAGDARIIRRLVNEAGINPMGLSWPRFWLAVDERGRVIGCCQVKRHGDGSRELASLVVLPEWRGQGIARALIERNLAEQALPLYLTCRASLGRLYEKFDFRTIGIAEMTSYYRRIVRAYQLVRFFYRSGEDLLVMKKG